jgi:predicted ferric reductase
MTALPRSLATARSAHRPRLLRQDAIVVLVGNGLLIIALWVLHGGLDQLGSAAGLATATGQLTALIGTYLALVQLVLMARSPWLDRLFGMDGLARAHRWLGFATVWLLVGHGVFTTLGFALADRISVPGELWRMITTYPFVLMAVVSLGLFLGVAVSSIRLARRRVSYETWHGLHLYAYLAIALGFGHQLAVGSDFLHDRVFVAYWVALYVVTAASILVFRLGAPIATSLRYRLRVANVVTEAPGVVSIYLTGRGLERWIVQPGQYLILRFLTHGWWRGHPFSISALPNGRWLRVTIKDLGDDSGRYQLLKVGTRVFVEGPYGNLTSERLRRERVLLIGGGIGVTPLRALLEELAGRRDVILLQRARREADLVFRTELAALSRWPGVTVHELVGSRRRGGRAEDPLSAAAIARLVPDVRERDVVLCGPENMMAALRERLAALRVPAGQIHAERFAF